MSALDDIGDVTPMKQDAEDLSPHSDNSLSLYHLAKEYLFRELSTADLRLCLSSSSKSALARSCKTPATCCTSTLSATRLSFGPRDQVASLDTEKERKVNDSIQYISAIILRLGSTRAEGFEVVGDKGRVNACTCRIGGSVQHAGWYVT